MQCASCGKQQPDGGAFCQYCGAPADLSRTVADRSRPAGLPGAPGPSGVPAGNGGLCVCGRRLTPQDQFCPGCGRTVLNPSFAAAGPPASYPGSYGAAPPSAWPPPPYGAYLPVHVAPQGMTRYRSKDKVAAGILAILLGGFGIHRFYLNEVGMGILYFLFWWTGIPFIAGLIEGIIYLCTPDAEWDARRNWRY